MKRANEVLVGILTTVTVAILVLGMYWLSRGTFKGGYPLYTVVDWGQGLKTGQKVLFAGVAIGFVDHVDLRREGNLVIEMIIDREYQIPMGSVASIQSASIFGDMMIAIKPAAPSDISYEAGDTLPAGKPGASATDIIASADSVTRTLNAILTGIQTELIQAGTIAQMRGTLEATNRLMTQLASVATLQSENLTVTMATMRRAVSAIDSARIDSTMRNFQRASSNVETLTLGLQSTSDRLGALLAKAESGDGTAAKLLNDPALYDDMRSVMGELRGLLTDFRVNPKRYLDFNFSIFGGKQ